MAHAITNTKGVEVAEAALQGLQTSLGGELIRPGDERYDNTRKVWNGMIDKHPAMIVRCAGVADVIGAVNFARENRLAVAVRGGAHGVAGNAVCDGGLVIDLSPMKGIRVDPKARTAWAQGGVKWGELDRETQAFGLATTGGTNSDTGIGGLTLGGGFGWLMGKCGLACDNLLSADIVTADGQFLTASANENRDLFWALRGGGGNFGVVTSFEYRLHPIGPIVLGGVVAWPIDRARDVLRFFRELTDSAPDDLTTLFALGAPDGVTPVVAMFACYSGSVAEGERALKPIREFGPPVMDAVGPMPYTQLQTMLDPAAPSGILSYWTAQTLKEISDDAIETIVEYCGAGLPSAGSLVGLEHYHGAVNRVGNDETAFAQRDGRYNLIVASFWTDPAENERQIQWTRSFGDSMKRCGTGGAYLNYLADEGQDRVKAAYGANYARLVALKNKYDPTNFFQLNQNIKPTA